MPDVFSGDFRQECSKVAFLTSSFARLLRHLILFPVLKCSLSSSSPSLLYSTARLVPAAATPPGYSPHLQSFGSGLDQSPFARIMGFTSIHKRLYDAGVRVSFSSAPHPPGATHLTQNQRGLHTVFNDPQI